MNRALNKVIKSQVVLAVLTVFAAIVLTFGVTYSLFRSENKNAVNQTIAVGTLSVDMTSISGAIVLNDLYPESASNITDEDTKYTFTLTNSGTYDVKYEVYLYDATETFLAANTSYSSYKQITSDYYQYINYKLDGTTVSNLASVKKEDRFVILSGVLKAGTSEEHYIQFFLDNKDTTTTGAPNDINGSIISLDIYLEAAPFVPTIVDEIIASANTGTPDFSQIATTDEGVYAMADDYGTSYYYRGAVTNNYVYFAGYYWRIIRINGDGSVRMIYDGTQAYTNGTSNTDRLALTNTAWNANYNDAKYVGWMFGGADGTASTSKDQAQTNEKDSYIKEKVDAWYKTNIVDAGYADAVSDEIFCNDREIVTDLANSNGGYYSSYTTLGYGTNATFYMAASRIGYNVTTLTPSFTCTQKNDAFTVSDTTNGNGALTYPVGLITADEVSAAGGLYNTANSSYYLYKGSWYWSLSPAAFDYDFAVVFGVADDGYVLDSSVNANDAVAPVINLSAEYARTLTGTGTATSPYTAS